MKIFKAQRAHGGAAFYAYTFTAAEGEITMAFDKDSPAGARVWKR